MRAAGSGGGAGGRGLHCPPRPLSSFHLLRLCIVTHPATLASVRAELDAAGLLAHLKGKVAKWWLPDAVVFVGEIPHTATGKIQKTELRRRFADFRFPS